MADGVSDDGGKSSTAWETSKLTTLSTYSLGRTARAGGTAKGVGILILAPFETFFLRKPIISSLPLSPHPAFSAAEVDQCRSLIARAMPQVGAEEKSQHYAAAIGFYKSSLRECFRGDAAALVKLWNDYATAPVEVGGLGCEEVPPSESLLHL